LCKVARETITPPIPTGSNIATGVNAPRQKRPNLFYPIFLNEETEEFYSTEDDKPKKEEDTIILPINPEGEELSGKNGVIDHPKSVDIDQSFSFA
jgi:hypothetical protein